MTVENNPFRPSVPELASGSLQGVVRYLDEQAAILREQYELNERRLATSTEALTDLLNTSESSLTQRVAALQQVVDESALTHAAAVTRLEEAIAAIQSPNLAGVEKQLADLATLVRRIDEGQQLQYVSLRRSVDSLTEQSVQWSTQNQQRDLRRDLTALTERVSQLAFRLDSLNAYAATGIAQAQEFAARADSTSQEAVGSLDVIRGRVVTKAELTDIPTIPPIPTLGWDVLLDMTGAAIGATQDLVINPEYTEFQIIGIDLATAASCTIQARVSFDGVVFETAYKQSFVGSAATAISTLAATSAATAARSFLWQITASDPVVPIVCRDSHRTHTRYTDNVGQLHTIRVELSVATTYTGGRLIIVGRK